MPRLTVGSKIFLGMGAVILSFTILSLWITGQLTAKFSREEVVRNLQHGKTAFDRFFSYRRSFLMDKARSISELPYLKATMNIPELDAETARYAVQNLQELSQEALTLLINQEGEILADSTDPSTVRRDLGQYPGVEDVLAGEEFSGIWEYRSRHVLVAVVPVIVGNQLLGALVLGEDLGPDFARETRDVTGRDVLILGPRSLLARSWMDEDSPALNPDNLHILIANLRKLSGQSTDTEFEVTTTDGPLLAVAIPIADTDITVVLSRALAELTALSRRTWALLILAGVPTVVVALVLSRLISRRISRPIRELMLASEAMARGDLDVYVKHRGHDEIGKLSESFNFMTKRIANLVGFLLGDHFHRERALYHHLMPHCLP